MDKIEFENALLEKISLEEEVAQYKKQYKIELEKCKDEFIESIKEIYGITYSFVINKSELPYPLYWYYSRYFDEDLVVKLVGKYDLYKEYNLRVRLYDK